MRHPETGRPHSYPAHAGHRIRVCRIRRSSADASSEFARLPRVPRYICSGTIWTMGILLDGGLDTEWQSRGGTRDREIRSDAQRGVTPGWNLVLSYGDLSTQSGYRTRVLGELQHLDSAGGLDPFLL